MFFLDVGASTKMGLYAFKSRVGTVPIYSVDWVLTPGVSVNSDWIPEPSAKANPQIQSIKIYESLNPLHVHSPVVLERVCVFD